MHVSSDYWEQNIFHYYILCVPLMCTTPISHVLNKHCKVQTNLHQWHHIVLGILILLTLSEQLLYQPTALMEQSTRNTATT